MMFNKNTKVKVCLSDGNTDFFDIVVRFFLRRNISTKFVNNLNNLNVNKLKKKDCFKLK